MTPGAVLRPAPDAQPALTRLHTACLVAPMRAAAALLLASAVAGCALFAKSGPRRAAEIEPLLTAAGFQAVPADSDAKLVELRKLPAYRLTYSTRGGQPHYWYADPDRCRCLYTGSEPQYARYEALLVERQIAGERRAAALAEEDAASIDEQMDYWLPDGVAMWPAGPWNAGATPELVEP